MKTSRTSKLSNTIRFIRKRLSFAYGELRCIFLIISHYVEIAPSQTEKVITLFKSLPCIAAALWRVNPFRKRTPNDCHFILNGLKHWYHPHPTLIKHAFFSCEITKEDTELYKRLGIYMPKVHLEV